MENKHIRDYFISRSLKEVCEYPAYINEDTNIISPPKENEFVFGMWSGDLKDITKGEQIVINELLEAVINSGGNFGLEYAMKYKIYGSNNNKISIWARAKSCYADYS